MTSGHKLFTSLDSMRAGVASLGLDIALEPEIREALTPAPLGRLTARNRFVAQPMEGCDGTLDGRPGELTFRRWRRQAAGGFGVLWGEATAVVPEGRANPRQLVLTGDTAADFARLVAAARAEGDAVIGVQLTHSGRYSRPDPLPPFSVDLDHLRRAYLDAARLAQDAGADFVDVKQCHGYLLSELLAEGRHGFALDVCAAIRDASPGLVLATRINVYDGVPHAAGVEQPEDEIGARIQAIGEFVAAGVELVNVTAGCPYTNPHVGRPADRAPADGYAAPEPPLAGVARHLALTEQVQRAFPALAVVGTGYSYLRHHLAAAGEAAVRSRRTTFVGAGRASIAYPDLVRDLEQHGAMDARKSCLTVSHCTNLMRSKGNDLGQFAAGCVPRDPVYAELLREARATWS